MMAAAPAAFGVGVANFSRCGPFSKAASTVAGSGLGKRQGMQERAPDGTPRRLAKVRLSAGLSAESRSSCSRDRRHDTCDSATQR